MRRRMWAYVLLTVCMLMQVAEVFPHHHHAGHYCLAPDLVQAVRTATCPDHMHHSDDADRHTCGSDCITNFQCSVSNKDIPHIAPDHSFYFLLYSLLDSSELLVPWRNERTRQTVFPYVSALYVCALVRSTGLRAPPVCLA